MYCSNCGNSISNNYNFCKKCGNKIDATPTDEITPTDNKKEVKKRKASFLSSIMEYKCEYCKSILNRGSVTCKKCGRTMTEKHMKSQDRLKIIAMAIVASLAIMLVILVIYEPDKKETTTQKNETKVIAENDNSGVFYTMDIKINSDMAERTKEYAKFTSEIKVEYSNDETNFSLRHVGSSGLVLGISFDGLNRLFLRESLIEYTNIYNSYEKGNSKSYVAIVNIRPLIFSEMADGINIHDSASDNKSEIYFEDGIFVIKYFGTHEPFYNMFYIDYENAIKLLKYSSDKWIANGISNQ